MKVLVADELSPRGLQTLRAATGLSVDVKLGLKPAELKGIVGGYQALAVRSATKVTADILESAGALKVIGRAGVGVDNIDVDAATRRNIVVMNTPGGNSMAVAELTMAMLSALPRQLVQAATSTKAGKWEKKRFATGHELFQKTVGILGLGNIGSLVAQRCLAFGMTVLVYDPHPSEAARKLGLSVRFVSLEELVRNADFLTVHVPSNDKTRNLVGASLFAQMKKGTYLVNCARGASWTRRRWRWHSRTAPWPARRWTSSRWSPFQPTTRCWRWTTSSPPRTSGPPPRRASWPAPTSSPSSWLNSCSAASSATRSTLRQPRVEAPAPKGPCPVWATCLACV